MTVRDWFDRQAYVTIVEYARKMRVTERTVRTWVSKGAIQVERRGRTVRIPLVQFVPRAATEVNGN